MSAALQQFAVQDQPTPAAELPPAPRTARFLAFVLDGIFASLLNAAGLALIKMSVHVSGVEALWSFSFWLLYWVFPVNATGQTLGKRLMKIQVLRNEGGDVSFGSAVLRELYKFVSAAVLFLGFVRILTHPQHRAWHDTWSGTRVVSLIEE